MYLVTNCVSSENYLIILKQLENLISSIDESPACISNKLAQARQRHFYPSHHMKCISGHLHFAKFEQRQKKAHVCVLRQWMHIHRFGAILYICASSHSGFSARILVCIGSCGGP